MSLSSRFLIAMPPVLIASMYAAFWYFTSRLGFPNGYLAAFTVYWIGWCVLTPTLILGRRAVLNLFTTPTVPFTRLGGTTHILLWWPLVFPLAFSFLPSIASTPLPIVIASIVLGVIIGVTEELLWRGLYVHAFPNRLSLNTIYPSIAFGVWHLCPTLCTAESISRWRTDLHRVLGRARIVLRVLCAADGIDPMVHRLSLYPRCTRVGGCCPCELVLVNQTHEFSGGCR
jgi:CAAX protease family protein